MRLCEGDDGATLDGEIAAIDVGVSYGTIDSVKLTIDSDEEGEWEFMADASLTELVSYVRDCGPFTPAGAADADAITIDWLDRAPSPSAVDPLAAPGARSRPSQLAE